MESNVGSDPEGGVVVGEGDHWWSLVEEEEVLGFEEKEK